MNKTVQSPTKRSFQYAVNFLSIVEKNLLKITGNYVTQKFLR
jgi:hypothetical protein